MHVHEGTLVRQDLLLCLKASRELGEPSLQLFSALSALTARGQVCDLRIQITAHSRPPCARCRPSRPCGPLLLVSMTRWPSPACCQAAPSLASSVPLGTIQQCDHAVWMPLRITTSWMGCAASSATVAHPKRPVAASQRADQPWTQNRSVRSELPENVSMVSCQKVFTAHSSPRQQRRCAVLMTARRTPSTGSHIHASTTSTLQSLVPCWQPIHKVFTRSNRSLTSSKHITLDRQPEY